MSYTYKNETDQELTIIGVGVVEAKGTITSDIEINNPNLKLVKPKSTDEKGKK